MSRLFKTITLTFALILASLVYVNAQSLSITGMSAGYSKLTPAAPGQIITVDGTDFRVPLANALNPRQTDVIFRIDNVNLNVRTLVESNRRLYFVVPIGLNCGEHTIRFENVYTTTLEPTGVFTESSFWIRCAGGNSAASPSKPAILGLEPQDATPGMSITITGRNFIFEGRSGLATKVILGGRTIPSRWISPTILEADLPSDYTCDATTEIHLVNTVREYPSGPVQFGQIGSSRLVEIAGDSYSESIKCLDSFMIQPVYKISNVDFPREASIGSSIQGTLWVENIGPVTGEVTVDFYIENELRASISAVIGSGHRQMFTGEVTFRTIGNRRVDIRTKDDTYSFIVNVSAVGAGASRDLTIYSVERFDLDKSCFIDDAEFFSASDAWIDDVIPDTIFFAILDAWVSNRNICSVSSSLRRAAEPQLLRTSNSVTFVEQNAIQSLQIFDSSGKRIYQRVGNGLTMRWNLRASDGMLVPNGVYFYRTTSRTQSGELIFSDLKKFVVLR